MKKIIENVSFMLDGTMVFGDLYLEGGFVERMEFKTPRGKGHIAIPGFVDIHTHGFRGYSCDDENIENLRQLANAYAKRGVTTFCPTLSPRPLQEYIPILKAYRKAFQGNTMGARYAGVHLEGPYLSKAMHCLLDANQLQEIDLNELDTFLSEYHEDIRVMTIAPELTNAMEAIHLLHLYGVQVSIGHSKATYEQMLEAFEEGASQVTHLCNAMPGIDHHEPTMFDAVLLSQCSCEMIMDGAHIQSKMLEWLIKLLGAKRVIAISDGTINSGLAYPEGHVLDDGSYIQHHAVYKEGVLKGSCIDLLDIFRKLYDAYGLAESILMTSQNAAHIVKSYTSDIRLGHKIDLVILDSELHLLDVVINGRSVL